MSEDRVAVAAWGSGPASQTADFSCEKYLFPGWTKSLAAVFAGMVISFVLFGLFYPFWWFSDQDLVLAYQGLLLNAGLPQEYFDHTGYLYILLISGWYSLLHWVGLLPVHALPEMPPPTDVPAFEAAWQQLIVAGRVSSLLLGGLVMWLYATLVRRLVGDWKIAVLAGMALALSTALIMHIRMMRTELLSGALVMVALFLLIFAARASRRRWRQPLYLALAAMLATLAIITKIQALFSVMLLPVIAITFGRPDPEDDGEAPLLPWIAAGWIALAVLATVPAAGLLRTGFTDFPGTVIPYRRLGIPEDIYQAAIALWFVVAVAVYCRFWKVRLTACAAGAGAMLLGVSLGLLSLDIRFQPEDVIAITHPVEHMFFFATWTHPALGAQAQILTRTLFEALDWGFLRALEAHDHEPVFLLQIFAIVGAVVAWRRGDRQLPLQVLVLIVGVFGLDAVFSLR